MIFNTEKKKLIMSGIKKVYSDEDSLDYYRTFALNLIAGVGLILFGLIWVVVGDALMPKETAAVWPPFGFLLCVAFGVGLIINASILNSRFKDIGVELQDDADESSLSSRIGGVVMLLAVLMFIISGFLFDGWNTAWVIFPIAGIVVAIFNIIFVSGRKKEK